VLSTTDAAPATFSLARFIEEARELVPVDGRVSHERLPDGRTALVLRVLDGGHTGDLCVAGPRTRALFKRPSNVTRAASLQLKPGWTVPLLGVPAHVLTDRIIPLEELWGGAGRELYEELLATRGARSVIECVSRAVARRVLRTFEPASARLARRAARLLEAGEGRVEHVATELGVTSRHLRRAFKENVGVGPKEFARAARLQRAVRMAASSRDWGRIATDAGYYDQAHLIADFRELVGLTPVDYVQRR
jgi:AraC-like DNA-binding protein